MMNETQLENICLEWFRENGWQCAHVPEIALGSDNSVRTDYRQVVLREKLLAALSRINQHIPAVALEQASHVATVINELLLIQKNRQFHKLLREGILKKIAIEITEKLRESTGKIWISFKL